MILPPILSFDIPAHRDAILRGELPPTAAWFFGEIHKYRTWRNYLKGWYDAAGERKRILVAGSARLDFYRFGGDSLQGRYYYLRLHPLSLAEVAAAPATTSRRFCSFRGSRNPSWVAATPRRGAGPWPIANGWCARR